MNRRGFFALVFGLLATPRDTWRRIVEGWELIPPGPRRVQWLGDFVMCLENNGWVWAKSKKGRLCLEAVQGRFRCTTPFSLSWLSSYLS